MSTQHTWAKEIIAFVNGEEVQWMRTGLDGAWGQWEPVAELHTFNHTGIKFRVKPAWEWDKNSKITIELPTPEHAAALVAILGENSLESTEELINSTYPDIKGNKLAIACFNKALYTLYDYVESVYNEGQMREILKEKYKDE